MIILQNNEFNEVIVKKFLQLREKLSENLIEILGDEQSGKILVYVKDYVQLEGVEVKDIKSLIKDKLSDVKGVDLMIEGYNVTCIISNSAPANVYEEITVRLYEIEKELGIKLNVIFSSN